MMYALILKLIYFIFLAYFAIAAFISIRDLMVTKGSRLWISLMVILFAILLLFFKTEWLPYLILPIVLGIALPIWITDKRRNWDLVDRLFRFLTYGAILAGGFMTLNILLGGA